MVLMSRLDRRLQIVGRGCERGRQDGQRIAIAACRDRIDRGVLVVDARDRVFEQQHGARGFHACS